MNTAIALLLAMCVLCSCGAAGSFAERPTGENREQYAAREICRFSEMVYERPDVEAFASKAAEIELALENGTSYRKLEAMLDELYAMYNSADTMLTLADIRNCQDLTDTFYAEEYAFCRSAAMEVNRCMERVYLACGASQYGERLEKNYFWEGFLSEYGPDSEETLTDAYLALANEESELIAQYRALMAEPTVTVNGKEQSLNDALYAARSNEEAYAVLDAYYEKYNPLAGEIFLKLLAVRKAQAKQLGYDSFAEMAFSENYERDYSVEEGHDFLESIRQFFVPVYTRVYDEALMLRLQEDYYTEEELYAVLEAAASGLGGEVKETYDFMRRYELCDLAMSERKPDMSFQAYLTDYEAPFLFANPCGDTRDLITVAHEFGHCVDAYISYDAARTIDLAEVFSQAMQYLAIGQLEETLGRRGVERLRKLNLLDTLESYVQQASFAQFEELAYAAEEPTLDMLNAWSLQLSKDYGYYDGESDRFYAMSWIEIPHFFEQPFYVISYPVSAGAALEIYEDELAGIGAGLERFLALVDAESPGIVEATAEAGLHNPLDEARVRETADFLSRQLAA